MLIPLLSRLRLRQKFALLGLLSGLLVGPPLWLYVYEANKAIGVSLDARAGMAPIQAAQVLLQRMQQHRGLSAAALGTRAFIPNRENKQAEVELALHALETEVARVPPMQGLLGTLRSDWTHLLQGLGSNQWTARESFELHTQLCLSLVQLIAHMSDTSGLSLNSNADRHHLIQAVFFALPAATEALGEVRAHGASALAAQSMDETDRILMHVLLSHVGSTQRALDDAMTKAMAANPALKPPLGALLGVAITHAHDALLLGHQEVATATPLRYPVADYLAKLTTTIDHHFGLLEVAIPALDDLLRQHIEQTQAQRNAMIAIVLLFVILATASGWLIANSVLQPMQKTQEIAQAISAGQLDTPITVDTGHGEGAHMLAALSHMQEALRLARGAEQAAKQDLFRDLLESAPDAVVVMDRAGVIILVNEQTLRLFGYERQALLGQPLAILVPPGHRAAHATHQQAFLAQPSMRAMGAREAVFGCRRDGSEFPAEISLSPLQTEQGLVVSATIRNISARLQAEHELQNHRDHLEELVTARTTELARSIQTLQSAHDELVRTERLASLGALVAGISHDLNTPIGNANLTASTLRDSVAAFQKQASAGMVRKSEFEAFLASSTEMSDLIVRSVQRASDLIASFKQVSVDQTSERRREFDLKACVDDVLATLKPGLKGKPWHIDVEIEDGLRCDSYPGPLGQILSNLVLNASLHAFEGRNQGRIQVSARAHHATEIELTLSDDGIGMPPETLAHAFDAFFTTKLARGGSGLGLSICKSIATGVLGGTLAVESAPGHGTRFTLIFPRTAPQSPAPHAPAEPAQAAQDHPDR